MSKVKDNLIVSGLHGQIGRQLVIRETNGQVIVTKMPSKPRKKASEAMRKQQVLFRRAARMAKHALTDPKNRARYEAARKPGQTAYIVALREFLLMLIAGKTKPDPTPPYRRKKAPGVTAADTTLLMGTDNGTVIKPNLTIPDEHLNWLLETARQSTTKKIRTIVLQVSCANIKKR